MTAISTEQFERARHLALRLVGIELFERHRETLSRRIRRLGIEDGNGFEALLNAAAGGDERAEQRLVGLVTTNFTHFFRHPRHFATSAEQATIAVRERGHARIWSAAASTGEEPFSAAIAILDAFGTNDPPVTILATDIDDDALDIAREAEYGDPSISTLDDTRRQRYFQPAPQQSRWLVSEAARRLVTIRRLNLIDPAWPVGGPFDVIFCRNVLMYLEAGCRDTVVQRMGSMLSHGGLLILDPAENLGRAARMFSHRGSGVFALRPSALPPRESSRIR